MSCEADITTDTRKSPLVVPIQGLTMRDVRVDSEGKYLPRAPGEKEKVEGGNTAAASGPPERRKEIQGVFLCVAGNRVAFRPVKTGIAGETDIEVLDGLGSTDEVVVGPLKALRSLEDGDAVEIDRSKPFKRFLKGRTAGEGQTEEEK